MKIAILIHAHKNPSQVARLCRQLSHPDIDIFVHVDAKADISVFAKALPHVMFISKRTDVRWGRFSQVEATLNSLREIISSSNKYDYIHFISGQDYPLISMDQFVFHLAENKGAEYLDTQPTDQDGAFWASIRKHYERYYYHYHEKPLILTQAINSIFKLPIMKRRPPMRMYFGSNWWTLTSDCIKYVLDYCRENPKYVRFFKTMFCGDELFFQTIISNSHFATRPNPGYMRYIDWSAKKRNPHILTSDDYDKMIASGRWFARKFDETVDSKVLDMLDKHNADLLQNSIR